MPHGEKKLGVWRAARVLIKWCLLAVLVSGSVAWAMAIDFAVGNSFALPAVALIAIGPSLVLAIAPWIAVCLAHASGPRLRSERMLARVRSRTERADSLLIRVVSLSALFASLIVVVVEWGPRKSFVGRVFSVKVGMSVDDVEAIMVGYIRGAGPAWHLPATDPLVVPLEAAETKPALVAATAYREPGYGDEEKRRRFTGIMVYRWSTDPDDNADWGVIDFNNGKVVSAKFLSD